LCVLPMFFLSLLLLLFFCYKIRLCKNNDHGGVLPFGIKSALEGGRIHAFGAIGSEGRD